MGSGPNKGWPFTSSPTQSLTFTLDGTSSHPVNPRPWSLPTSRVRNSSSADYPRQIAATGAQKDRSILNSGRMLRRLTKVIEYPIQSLRRAAPTWRPNYSVRASRIAPSSASNVHLVEDPSTQFSGMANLGKLLRAGQGWCSVSQCRFTRSFVRSRKAGTL